MSSRSELTLAEAVETLSNIAEMGWDRTIGISDDHHLTIQQVDSSQHNRNWVHQKEAKNTVNAVKEIFRVVLNYLKQFDTSDYTLSLDNQTMEGIKTMMVLVGEAAKKIDKCTLLFQEKQRQSVTELKEYKQLQEFYLRKISHTIDEGILGKWILGLTKHILKDRRLKIHAKRSPSNLHVFVDLESVKKDTDYELFLIRKEDGTRFFSPRLIRNMKLVSDFGNSFNQDKDQDSLLDPAIWKEREAKERAKELVHFIKNQFESFFKEAFYVKDEPLIRLINKCLLALMLASSSRNPSGSVSAKNAFDYLNDFKSFLREALSSLEYQRLLTYSKEELRAVDGALLALLHHLCLGIYKGSSFLPSLDPFIKAVIEEARNTHSSEHEKAAEDSNCLWSYLSSDYVAIQKLLARQAEGPLTCVLKMLEEGAQTAFDPYLQGNMPNAMYYIHHGEKPILHMRVPSPTHQAFIQQAGIIPEFKGFLRSFEGKKSGTFHLLINLQDRTSWCEQARAAAIVEMGTLPEFKHKCSIVTLAKDTEFYHQLAPYYDDHQAHMFINHLKRHFDAVSGFDFEKTLSKQLSAAWLDGVINATHRIFFSNKNVLSRQERLNFIEILYLFFTLKILELTKPDSFSFSCKDSLDVGCAVSAEFFCFLKLISDEPVTVMDREFVNAMLYGPVLFSRQRVIFAERFNRMNNALKTVEWTKEELGEAQFCKIIQEAYGIFIAPEILKSRPFPLKNYKIS